MNIVSSLLWTNTRQALLVLSSLKADPRSWALAPTNPLRSAKDKYALIQTYLIDIYINFIYIGRSFCSLSRYYSPRHNLRYPAWSVRKATYHGRTREEIQHLRYQLEQARQVDQDWCGERWNCAHRTRSVRSILSCELARPPHSRVSLGERRVDLKCQWAQRISHRIEVFKRLQPLDFHFRYDEKLTSYAIIFVSDLTLFS